MILGCKIPLLLPNYHQFSSRNVDSCYLNSLVSAVDAFFYKKQIRPGTAVTGLLDLVIASSGLYDLFIFLVQKEN